MFTTEIGVQAAGDTAELQVQMGGRAPELSLEQREKRTLAKRIIKAVQPALEEALKNESELNRKPFESELKDLDYLLEESVQSRKGSPVPDGVDRGQAEDANGIVKEVENGDASGVHAAEAVDVSGQPQNVTTSDSAAPEPPAEDQQTDAEARTAPAQGKAVVNGDAEKKESASPQPPNPPADRQKEPLTPPLSFQDDQNLPLAQGGVQWYMQPFDPVGTTIHEERWTGRDVMRGMSEELSELDEDELKDLVDDEPKQEQQAAAGSPNEGVDEAPATEEPVKVHRTRRRGQGFR